MVTGCLTDFLAQNNWANKNFSGLGLVIYKPEFLDLSINCCLRPNAQIPSDLYLHNAQTYNYLKEISHIEHSLHDGYVFFNSKGKLTHVSQYVAAPITKQLVAEKKHGVRHLTSRLISLLPSVISVGFVSSNGSKAIIQDGEYTWI